MDMSGRWLWETYLKAVASVIVSYPSAELLRVIYRYAEKYPNAFPQIPLFLEALFVASAWVLTLYLVWGRRG